MVTLIAAELPASAGIASKVRESGVDPNIGAGSGGRM